MSCDTVVSLLGRLARGRPEGLEKSGKVWEYIPITADKPLKKLREMGAMACNYIDLPAIVTPLPGKRLLKVELQATGDDGRPEIVYTYVMPMTVALENMANGHRVLGEMEGQESASVLAFKKANG